jgi:hypothetical protein
MTLRFSNRILQIRVTKASIEEMVNLGSCDAIPRHLFNGLCIEIHAVLVDTFYRHIAPLVYRISETKPSALPASARLAIVTSPFDGLSRHSSEILASVASTAWGEPSLAGETARRSASRPAA